MLNVVEESPSGATEARKRYGAPTVQSRVVPLIALVALGVWMFFLYRHYLNDTPVNASFTALQKENADFLSDVYQKSGGKFDKVDEADKNKLRRMAGVHAEELYRYGAKAK